MISMVEIFKIQYEILPNLSTSSCKWLAVKFYENNHFMSL